MSTDLILASHTFANSKHELNTVKKNEFQDDQSVVTRKIKVVDYPVMIQPDIGADYGKTVKYWLNNHTGMLTGKDLALLLTLSASTVSAGVGSYVDGFILACIKRIRLMSASREIYKMDKHAIHLYNQRASSERKEFMKTQCRIGATGADIAINTAQTGVVLMPNPFNDFSPLKLDLLRDRPYYEVEFEPRDTIVKSTLAYTSTGYIMEATIYANYLKMNANDKADAIRKTMTQNEFIDYINISLPAGTTTTTIDIPFNESEYLCFYVEDTTTNQPFTGISTVSGYHMNIDNHTYPELNLPMAVQALQQTQYFKRKFDKNVYTLRFSSFASSNDELSDYHQPYGSLVMKSISNPKLQIDFSAGLANTCVVHILNYGRAFYKYENGELVCEHKN